MRTLLIVVGLLLATVAQARTVAVLPFQPAAASESWEGLGRALAGMLVSDLARVPGLELVERARLDALLTEIHLGEQGYLDPNTAQRLGQGTGAAWVVVGSFSVLGDTFLLDGRAVEVASGRVLAAADARGTVADFVSVEKALVEDLLAGLQVALTGAQRRQILAETPTESFGALAAYGAGLQAEFEGRVEAARARFEEAARHDPAFDAPQARLLALRARLEQLDRSARHHAADARAAQLTAALGRTAPELDRRGPSRDPNERARMALRFKLLERLGQPCQAADELAHYLDRHQGRIVPDPHPAGYNALHREAWLLGLYPFEPPVGDRGVVRPPRSGHEGLVDRARGTTSVSALLVGIADGPDQAERLGGSLLNLSIACAGADPAARVAAVEQVVARATRWKLLDTPLSEGEARTVGMAIEGMRLHALADRDGMSAEVEAGTARLLALDLPSDAAFGLRAKVQAIARAAQVKARRDAELRGLPPARVLALQRGWAAADPAVLDLARPGCAVHSAPAARAQAAATLARIEAAWTGDGAPSADAWTPLLQAASEQSAPHLMGCLVGLPGPLGGLPEVVAWLDTAPSRLREGRDPEACAQALSDTQTTATAYARMPDPEGKLTATLARIVAARLIEPGCVAP